MSNGTITLSNPIGKYDLDVTTFQMAVLFCWENRRYDSLTLENLRLGKPFFYTNQPDILYKFSTEIYYIILVLISLV